MARAQSDASSSMRFDWRTWNKGCPALVAVQRQTSGLSLAGWLNRRAPTKHVGG
jgi:hypothetical protein